MLGFPLLCRLCGLTTDNGLYIYCDEGKRRQVETKIRLYLHFQVLPSDSLPKKICASCFEELEGMHRFAINALKVQDNLSKIAKELPLTATDICKSFMKNYVAEPVIINDTVASLTNQEVTEMEVQVDPMFFLEDDQIDENDPVSDCGANNNFVQNGEEANVRKGIDGTTPSFCLETHSESELNGEKQMLTQSSVNNDIDISQKPNANEVPEVGPPVLLETQVKLCPETKAEDGFDSGELSKGDTEVAREVTKAVSLTLKRVKKVSNANKNSKRSDLKSLPSENIKCITYTCPICKKVLMKKGLFKTHLETHKTDHKYACEICLRVFKKEINLIRHQKSHSELTTFPCAHCNRVYPTKSTLRSHLVSHSDERPHVCNICTKSFKRNQDLKFHLNQHNGLRPYRCPYCTKAFASSGNCFSHRRRAHMQEIERDRALRKNAPAAS
ncbi:zinc finger protein Gfi-1b-like [Frankliniella occidentalis]|uniref:Zinc finger protein Gfi-1b-like n=1 Tax=Frankliniella occidentalis TaxID=133901 RepID=A0A6J1SC34_FRAOC|nr:zinc finger protein Gfi-1b-like [Frankliniella occidentalis]